MLVLRQVDKKLQSFDGSIDSFLDEQSLNVISSIPSALKENPIDDLTSHYILRLGLSKNTEFTEWFIKTEEALFLCKLRQDGNEALNQLIRELPELRAIGKEVISRQSNSVQFENIRRMTPFPGDRANSFYCIDFRDVPPALIARRTVVIERGTAYVPDREIVSLVGKKFKDFLAQAMIVASRQREYIVSSDDRMKIIADRISPSALLVNTKASTALSASQKLSLTNFNLLLVRSMPPCMRYAVESMRPTDTNRSAGRHLKNTGRNQLTPFLRAAGFTMEESLQWWKTEFTRHQQMDSDKFDKNYNYNIKWVYGKAGRMKAAGSMSCSTVINLEYPSNDQTHGCPFKVLDQAKITNLLKGWLTKSNIPIDVNEGKLKEIVRKATGQTREYQLACVDWFTLLHEGHSGEGVGNHPNSYFSESVKYWSEKEGTANELMDSTLKNEASLDQPHMSQTRAG